MKLVRSFIWATAALALAVAVPQVHADTISASLFSPLPPPAGSVTTILDTTGVTAPSQSTVTGSGYSISFSSVPSTQGIVQGDLSAIHAVPVGGVTGGGAPTYLTGNYGSALTPTIANSGNYFSTGLGNITFTFDAPQTSLALLWGSIDTTNSLTFNNATNYTVTGTAVQTAAAGFISNGFQGPGGSAYVIVNTTTPFTSFTATSGVVSFEFAGVAASNQAFSQIPEPGSVALLGLGLSVAGFVLHRRKKNA